MNASPRQNSQRVIDQYVTDHSALYLGDSAEVLRGLPSESVHLSVFSPPFSALYTYSSTERDLGNTRGVDEFFAQYRFIAAELLRVMMTGRLVCAHVQDIQSSLNTHGVRKLLPFALPFIEVMEEIGFQLVSMITIDKNPQTQAARNKVHELMFATKARDAASLRPTLPEYLCVFKKPGKNPIPICDPIDNDTWIKWAHGVWPATSGPQEEAFVKADMDWRTFLEWSAPVWYGIRETDVLNAAVAKADQDERHLCPLQLPVIERCVRLWSNPGENVLSPFAGVGSEVYQAIRCGRRGVGIELKPEYWRVAVKNAQRAVDMGVGQMSLFQTPALESRKYCEPPPVPAGELPCAV